MTEIYRKYGEYCILFDNEKFGLQDNHGNTLLPNEYDSISSTAGGFIIARSARFGFIKFYEETSENDAYNETPLQVAELFLPCIYNRIEPKENGLVLYKTSVEESLVEEISWFDFLSRKIYNNFIWIQNFNNFDAFLKKGRESLLPFLKKAGEDFYIDPQEDNHDPMEFLYEILYYKGVNYILCSRETLVKKSTKKEEYVCKYFLMILYDKKYIFTEPEENLYRVFECLAQKICGFENYIRENKT